MATINELQPPYRVGYFVGSLSVKSINRVLARALVRLAPHDLVLSEIPIGGLPLYNRDLDGDFPPEVRDFKAAIATQQALLFVTPEYNRSIPGALKNAIDWASRPYGENVIARKATAVIGASPGQIGTAVAQQQLRSVLSFLQAPQMNAPEAYIWMRPGLIDDDGVVNDESTEAFLQGFMNSFFEYIERVLTVVPSAT
jgi:chromate reductase